MVLARRRFTLTCPGPRPKLRGSICSPADGLGSSRPYRVSIRPGLLESAAIPGRPLNSVGPKRFVARCDIERRTGLHYHERADTHVPFQVDGTADSHAVMHVGGGRTVFAREV